MKAIHRTRNSGFSLLEVMIAVVVLATGLLALAALQGSLTRASAEAKVRGRVAALLSAHMDELRATQYASAQTLADDGCATDLGADDWVPASFCTEAGIGEITATQTVTLYSSAVGASSFSTTHTPAAGDPEFKRVVLTATWSDAGGTDHRLAMDSQLSDLALKDSLFPSPSTSGTPTGAPVVRQDSPETAGVIPIAMGNGDSSAASNPTPELVGKSNNQTLVGTRFNVLTYTPTGGSAVIQKRFENDVIKCTCQYGAGGDNLPEIYRTAQWPAVWTGTRYDVYSPDPVADAPGQSLESGPKSGVDQSALCTECCRDHHDTNATGVAKFDPERSDGSVSKYYPNGAGTLVQVTNSGNDKTYIDSCRIIRVDGFWRTASDMYSRQFGLLETETVSSKQAKTGLPTTDATTAYTSFVKNYLKQYDGTVGTAPAGAQAAYDGTTNINNPATVAISTPSNSDYRYLHARGLYVDYLEEKARNKLASVLASTSVDGQCPTGTPLEDCVLPFLPFTTINLTELAKWVASDTNVLTVNSQNQLGTDPTQPSGGRTLGVKVGDADNNSSMRRSSSGVAASSIITGGVDPTDASLLGTDSQPFHVGGVVNTGDHFDVRVSGGYENPFVFYTFPGDTGECLKPDPGIDHRCNTNSSLASLGGSIRVGNYNKETTVTQSLTATCSDGSGGQITGSFSFDVPTYQNYSVTAAAIGGTPATSITSPAINEGKTDANDPKQFYEYVDIAFASIPANSRIDVTVGSPTSSSATIQSCTVTRQNKNKPWVLGTVIWIKPWTTL